MLEGDQEYIALVSKHLSSDDLNNWVKTRFHDWCTFHSFLEHLTKDAWSTQVLEETRNGFNVPQHLKTCEHCNGDNASRFCKKQKPKMAKVLTVGDKKTCQACGQEAHKVKFLDGNSIVSNHTVSCPDFKSANHAGKVELLN